MRQNPAFWLEIITKLYIVLSDIVPGQSQNVDYEFTLRYLKGDSAKRGRGDARPDSRQYLNLLVMMAR